MFVQNTLVDAASDREAGHVFAPSEEGTTS